MNSIVKWFAKKYAVSLVNDMLEKLQEHADIQKYKEKTDDVLQYLCQIMNVLEDNKVTQEEAEKIIESTKDLFK